MPFSPPAGQYILKDSVESRIDLEWGVIINLPELDEAGKERIHHKTRVIAQRVSLDLPAHAPAHRSAAVDPQCRSKGSNNTCSINQLGRRIKESWRVLCLGTFDSSDPHQIALELKLNRAALGYSTLRREDAYANLHQAGRDKRKSCQVAQCAINYAQVPCAAPPG